MNNKVQIELLYEARKKSMLVAYIVGAFFGGLGVHYFYAGRNDLGLALLGCFVLSLVAIPLVFVWVIFVFVGVVHTKYVVEEVNNTIRKECNATQNSYYY